MICIPFIVCDSYVETFITCTVATHQWDRSLGFASFVENATVCACVTMVFKFSSELDVFDFTAIGRIWFYGNLM